MTDNINEWPPKCPSYGNNQIKEEKQSEYTGGGYADYWYEF